MPAEGVALTPDERLLSLSELERIVKVFANLGVQKIRLTGGEPLVRRDLVDIIGEKEREGGRNINELLSSCV